MPKDDTTYGFSKGDAESLLRHVGGLEYEYLEGRAKDRRLAGNGRILFEVDSVTTAGSSSPYNSLKVATCTVITATCGRSSLIGASVEVVDHSVCMFDETEAALTGRRGWAHECVAESLASGAAVGELTPCHWQVDGMCCPE